VVKLSFRQIPIAAVAFMAYVALGIGGEVVSGFTDRHHSVVAIIAGGWRAREITARMAALAFNRRMLARQRKAGGEMVKRY
jgi:hypothetical protein